MAKTPKIQKLTSTKILSLANNDFTSDLYQALVPECKSKNVIFSSFSVHEALGMIALGARSDTRTELTRALNFDEDIEDEAIGTTYNSVISTFQKASGSQPFTLLTANRVYCQSGFPLNSEFVHSLKKHFMVDFEQLNFSNANGREVAVGTINKWVAAETKNKITNLVGKDDFTKYTSLVLLNAIYFKGLWEHPFSVKSTSPAKFHVTSSKHVEVNMMHKQTNFAYRNIPSLEAEAVSLPYKGGRLSMIIVLPKAVEGLKNLQGQIGTLIENGKSIISRNHWSRDVKVKLSLPRFRIETSINNLSEVLKNLGMKLMFNGLQADFSGIYDEDKIREVNLYVSNVVQKAFIEVNEEGAEAAAATAVLMATMATRTDRPPPKIIPFVVDHPFYFQIVDHDNGDMVLFSGHCSDPTEE